jgi:uroporphyrinogen decarboxylase
MAVAWIFESSKDLVGFEPLCSCSVWIRIFSGLIHKNRGPLGRVVELGIKNYHDLFVFYRMGDDLGHKTSTMLDPDIVRQHILPQYKRLLPRPFFR